MGTAGTSKGRRERRDTGQREQGGHASELLFDYVDKRKLQDHLVASLRMKPQPKSGWSTPNYAERRPLAAFIWWCAFGGHGPGSSWTPLSCWACGGGRGRCAAPV